MAHQVLELVPLPRRLVEETIRRVRGRQDEERRGPTKVRVLTDKRFEDADGGLGIDREHAVLLDVAELTRRRVVEGEDDGRRAGREHDAPVEQVAKGDQPVALCVERPEVAPEVLGRPRPARLGIIDLVVLENHHAAELVGRELVGRGERDQQERRDQGEGENQLEASLLGEPLLLPQRGSRIVVVGFFTATFCPLWCTARPTTSHSPVSSTWSRLALSPSHRCYAPSASTLASWVDAPGGGTLVNVACFRGPL